MLGAVVTSRPSRRLLGQRGSIRRRRAAGRRAPRCRGRCRPPSKAFSSASNDFSFALWKTINAAQRDSNVFVSPLSASFALGMTMNGASGTTFDEMRSALRFGSASLASIDTGYKSLIGLLTSLDPATTMQIANAIFYRSGFPFNQSFLNDASTYFDAQVTAAELRRRARHAGGGERLGEREDQRSHSEGARERRRRTT